MGLLGNLRDLASFNKQHLLYQGTDPVLEERLIEAGLIKPHTTQARVAIRDPLNKGKFVGSRALAINHYVVTEKSRKYFALMRAIPNFI